jgi:hypothetical protein
MTEDDKENRQLVRFGKTTLVEIKPGQSTLPIDTAAEWSNTYILINDIISLLKDDITVETFIDDEGNTKTRHHIPSQLLQWVQTNIKMREQIWKMMGGEARVEGQKQHARNMADLIFQMGKDAKTRDELDEKIKIVIDAEFADEYVG